MAKLTLVACVLRGTDGSIDHSASLAAFGAQLSSYEAERETESEVIGAAVDAVFDAAPGVALTMPALQSMACQQLNANGANWSTLSEKVGDYVRARNQGEGALFVTTKGRNGGTKRISDLPATPSAK